MELEAKVEERVCLDTHTHYFILQCLTKQHMYGKIRIKEEIVMLKILFQGDSLTDCGR